MSDLKYWARPQQRMFAFKQEYMFPINRPDGYERFFTVLVRDFDNRLYISTDESSPTIPLDALMELVEALKAEFEGGA